MIYYFSGTGNSRLVAKRLGELLQDRLSPMLSPEEPEEDILGLVFPVYAWGIPSVVEKFVRESLRAYILNKGTYIYAVMTCGDDVGYADAVLEKALLRHCGLALQAVFSVCMPNTYVALPGFDVDSRELARSKIAQAASELPLIAQAVSGRERVTRLVRGAFPRLKTYAIRPLFNRFLVTDKRLHANAQKCTACGKCMRSCPVGNISRDSEGRPVWQGHCAGCLACYHTCPSHAVGYGSMTEGKGQKPVFGERQNIDNIKL